MMLINDYRIKPKSWGIEKFYLQAWYYIMEEYGRKATENPKFEFVKGKLCQTFESLVKQLESYEPANNFKVSHDIL